MTILSFFGFDSVKDQGYLNYKAAFFTFVCFPDGDCLFLVAMIFSLFFTLLFTALQYTQHYQLCGHFLSLNDANCTTIPWIVNGVNEVEVGTVYFFIITIINAIRLRKSIPIRGEPADILLLVQWMLYTACAPLSITALIAFEGTLNDRVTITDVIRGSSWVCFLALLIIILFGRYPSSYKHLLWSSMILLIHYVFVGLLLNQEIYVYPQVVNVHPHTVITKAILYFVVNLIVHAIIVSIQTKRGRGIWISNQIITNDDVGTDELT